MIDCRIRHRRAAAARCVVHFLFLVLVHCSSGPLRGAPHVIGPGPHPYDPDWPHVQWIVSTKCFGCHRAGSERSDLSTYQRLVDAVAGNDDDMRLVVPGKPEESLLWEYVAWNVEASADSSLPDRPEMPLEKHEWLTRGQLDTIHRWLKNGAHQFKGPSVCDLRPWTEIEFPSARVCAQCHKRQFDEWSRSMHAYAQHSPIFEAFNLTLIERTGGTIGTFCTRCHTPIGTALGENGSRRNVNRSRISMEGVTCVVCHRRGTSLYKNNGRFPIEPGGIHEACMYGPFESSLSSDTGAHRSVKLPYIRTSQFCGECHDVVTPSGVRNEEAFSEWQCSPAAKAGITCQVCHMGPVQGIPIPENERPLGHAAHVPGMGAEELPLRRLTDHTFAGPDYSLLPDTEFPHKLDWMYETDYRDLRRLTPYQQATLRELRIRNRESLKTAASKRVELLGNAARIRVRHSSFARTRRQVPVRVDITSIFSGHNLPTGFTAERQLWVSVEVRDPNGYVVFQSGNLDHNGDLLDEHSYEVLTGETPHDTYLMNLQSKFTALGNKGTERSVVISVNRHLTPLNVLRPATEIAASFGRPSSFRLAKASVPPLQETGQTYPVSIPNRPGPYVVRIRLNFRHLSPTLLDHIGAPHLKHLLEIVTIDEYEGAIHVRGSGPTDQRSTVSHSGEKRMAVIPRALNPVAR